MFIGGGGSSLLQEGKRIMSHGARRQEAREVKLGQLQCNHLGLLSTCLYADSEGGVVKVAKSSLSMKEAT
jgi:hypothetical protein